MGYTTYFEGGFSFNKKISNRLKDYINGFANTRHMLYNTEKIKKDYEFYRIFTYDGNLGENGCLINDTKRLLDGFKSEYVLDYNNNGVCPSLWAQWIVSDDGTELVWDGGEKFYEYDKWLVFYINNFFKKEDIILNGVSYYFGEDSQDAGFLIVDNNKVYMYNYLDTLFEEVIAKHNKNEEIVSILKSDDMTAEKFRKCYNFGYDEE